MNQRKDTSFTKLSIKTILIVFILSVIVQLLSFAYIEFIAADKLEYGCNAALADTVVVLGVISSRRDGSENHFFNTRIAKTVELFECGMASHIVVSGNYNRRGYNEARDMQLALIRRGIPYSSITVDDQSYRTFDSFRFVKNKLGIESCLIVSQEFHCKRALAIASHFGIRATACPAENPEILRLAPVYIREFPARLKAIIDLYLLEPEERELSPG